MRRLVLSAVAGLFAVAAMPQFASATFIPGPNGKITFASGRSNAEYPATPAGDDTKARIWIADYPFGTPVQATTEPKGVVQHRHPNWSPDHSKIVYAAGVAFSGEYALWIVDLKTGNQTEFVAKAPMQDRPSWSPDGDEIAYASNGDLYVKDADAAGNAQGTKITTTVDIDERPVWSPDGNTLYFNRGPGADRDLYKISPATSGGTVKGVLTTVGTSDWQPALSPDGKRLCYLQGPQSDAAKLRLIDVDGTGDSAFTGDGVTGALNCVWSPDGTTILYTRGAFGGGDLATRDINGGNFTSLNSMNVGDNHFDGNADWATNFSPTCEPRSADIGVNQFTTVTLSCTDPDSGFGKAAPTPDELEDNAIEILQGPKNGTLGSIGDDRKVIYSPNKDFKGTDTFTYTGEDNASAADPATVTIRVGLQGPGGGGGGAVDKTAPVVSAIKVSKKLWRLGKGLAKISLLPVGTNVSFRLNEAAQATVSFQRSVPRKGGGKRFVNAGSLKAFAAKAGKNKVAFQGRLTRTKSLAPGTYRVQVAARDAAGNRAKPKAGPTFTISE